MLFIIINYRPVAAHYAMDGHKSGEKKASKSGKAPGSRQPQRGERKGFDAGTLPGPAAPSGA